MSEKLAKLAHKIDFLADVKGHKDDKDKEEEEKSLVTFQPSQWPWDSVRENLRYKCTCYCLRNDSLEVLLTVRFLHQKMIFACNREVAASI